MSVFGDIISTNKPVLIVFYAGWHYLTEDASTSIQQVADTLGDAVRVIKIDSYLYDLLQGRARMAYRSPTTYSQPY